MSPFMAGVAGFVLLLVFMALRMPIALTFATVGILGGLYLGGAEAVLGVLGTVPYTWSSYFVLITIPMFILMGEFAFHAGISKDLYVAAQKFLGRLPGGLAMATMAACTAFAACSGSSVASAAAMGTICLPEMKKYKYDRRLATGTVAMGGTLGILIPPSGTFIIYGVMTEESIGRLFMAGVLPGFLLSTMYMAMIFIRARRNPALAPPADQVSWGERLVGLKDVWAVVVLFGLVMGGIWGGVFTATEAAAVGAAGALILAAVKRRFSWKMLVTSLTETTKMTGMILMIIICAMIFNYFITITNLPMDLAGQIAAMHISPYAVLGIILLTYIILGMFMDTLAMVVLTVPLFYAIITSLGFDGIWFGVIVVVMAEIGLVTPPVGMNCFVIAGVAKDVPLTDIFRGVMPFVVVAFIGVFMLIIFPQISLWIPGTMMR